jgi:hypothetical protein
VSQTSPDARHLVRALDALTTQVRRIADAVSTRADAPSGYHPTGVRPEPTTAPDTPSPIAGQTTAADEDQALKWARRESLLVLLTRLQRGRTLTEDEARTLRHHVETEMREADTARAVARGNRQHVQTIVPEIDRLAAELEDAEQRADGFRVQRDQAQAATERVRKALDDRPPLIAGATGQPASDYEAGWHDHDRMVRRALDGTEQPTTKEN